MSAFKKGFVIGSVITLLFTPITYKVAKSIGKEANKNVKKGDKA